MQIKNNIHQKLLKYAISLLPPALISGPLLADLIVCISSLYFLIFLWKSNQINFIKNDFSKIFLIFCVYNITNSFFADDIIMSLKNSLFYIRFLLLIFLIKFLILKENKFLKLFFISLVISFSIVIIDAIVEYYLGYHWLFDKSTYPEFLSGSRISGLFDEEYIMGSYLLKLYPILLSLTFITFNNNQKKNFIIFIITLFVLIGIIVSGERTSVLTFLIIIFLYLLFLDFISNIRKRVLLIISTLFISILIVVSNDKISNRLIFHSLNSFFSDASFNYDIRNTDQRFREILKIYVGEDEIDFNNDVLYEYDDENQIYIIKEWKINIPKPNRLQIIEAGKIAEKNYNNQNLIKKYFTNFKLKFIHVISRKDKKLVYYSTEHHDHALISIHMFKESPIFGHGLKMFRVKCHEKKYNLGERSCTTHSHNILLTFLSELGIIGLLFYLTMIFLLIKEIKNKSKIKKLIPISLLILLLPIMPSGYFFNNFSSILFYISIGFYFGIKKINLNRISIWN